MPTLELKEGGHITLTFQTYLVLFQNLAGYYTLQCALCVILCQVKLIQFRSMCYTIVIVVVFKNIIMYNLEMKFFRVLLLTCTVYRSSLYFGNHNC